MNQKHWKSIYANVSVDLMEENVIPINGKIMTNVGVSVCKEGDVWNSSTCSCKNGKYSASIMDDYVLWSYRVIQKRNKNYSNIF